MKNPRTSEKSTNNRRQFLKQAAGAAIIGATLGTSKAIAQVTEAEYDYIVVGSGAGGAPVAARLAMAGFRVLVIEAGPKEVNANAEIPGFHLKSTEDPKYSWDFFVKHYADEAQHGQKYQRAKKGMLYPRASAIGGCTIHNALIPIYPNHSDLVHLHRLTGDAQFSPQAMRRIYEQDVLQWLSLEKTSLTLALKDSRLPRMFLAALQEGLKRETRWPVGEGVELLKTLASNDPNSRDNIERGEEGLFLMPKMSKNGRRHGPRNFLLETQQRYPSNLTIVTDTLVSKVLFSDDRRQGLKALGVECIEKDHIYQACPVTNELSTIERFTRSKVYRAKREVILAGGAFNSPQILMLSGIGDEAQLRGHGIRPLLSLPGVGKNLQDRYEMTVVNDLGAPTALTKGCTFGEGHDPCLDDYRRNPTDAVYGSNGLVVGLKVKSDPALAEPDLMLFGGPVKFTGYYPGYSRDALNRPDTFTWAILKGQTKNTSGEVRLASKDPTVRPEINFHYFTNGADHDMRAMVEGLNLTRRIVGRYRRLGLLALDLQGPQELFPGAHLDSAQELAQITRKEAWGHHASCSNKMGPASDPQAVVGSDFKVHGTQNLRVVDASVFPKIPGLFIALPTFMMAEKAAKDILRGAGLN